ncbi:hypothetical protein [Neorhizobium alkalisoli]|jgi:hypothetical protein|uniref:hypothetical protein n=1 Tax=Neorhizobium alkalisoli TaxID=528178 RepID=UPI0011A4ADDD|nr:hypothetical protein [Neorhizobium alkalisoli]
MRLCKYGVTFFYDSVAKSIFMAKGDQFEHLIGPFEAPALAISAGVEKCRRLGWMPSDEDEVVDAESLA